MEQGAVVAGFAVGGVVREDGLGALHRATGPAGRQVYLRLVPADAPGLARIEQLLTRFEGVAHRNVARVLDGEEIDGGFFYTLEGAARVTLGEVREGGHAFSEDELLWVGCGVLAGLAALHDAGLFHGGVSPATIALGPAGPVLLDVGWDLHLQRRPPSPAEGRAGDLSALREALEASASAGLPASFGPLFDSLDGGAGPGLVAWRGAAKRAGLDGPAPPTLAELLAGGPEAPAAPPPATEQPPAPAAQPKAPAMAAARSSPPEPDRESLRRNTIEYARAMLDDLPEEEEEQQQRHDGPPAVAAPPPSPAPATPDPRPSGRVQRGSDPTADTRGSMRPAGGVRETARSRTGEAPSLGRFGGYQLQGEIATGRTSTVFEATEVGRPGTLALKVLLPGTLKDDAAKARFLRGAEAAETLQHPAIARVYTSGVQDGWAYVAGELVRGEPLGALCRAETELGAQLPRIVLEALRAVEYAHGRGVVHGDLRPDQIRVTEAGRPKVVGFALPRLSRTGGAAPEPSPYEDPALGSEPSERADIYALGMILYEVATGGRLPSQAPGAAQTLLGAPVPPSVLAPHPLPRPLDAIALRALSTDPETRYPTVAALANDLQRCVLGDVQASLPGAGYALRLWVVRQPLAAAATLLLAFGLVFAISLGVARLGPRLVGAEPPPNGVAVTSADQAVLRGEVARLELELAAARRDAATAPPPAQPEPVATVDPEPLVELGDTFLRQGEPGAARAAFEAALALDPDHEPARAGVAAAEAQLAARPTEGAAGDAAEPLERGRGHLARGELALARAAFLEALALGAPHAKGFLDTVTERQIDAEVTAHREDEARSRATRAAESAARGEQLLEARSLDAAQRAFLEAYGLDPTNARARAGLAAVGQVRVDQARAAAVQAQPSHPTGATAKAQVAAAEAAVTRGRQVYQENGDVDPAVGLYLDAVMTYERVRALQPEEFAALRARQQAIAQELSAILDRDDQAAVADTVLALVGLERGQVTTSALPEDPHLIVDEAEQTSIRRAFAGPVRFLRTRVFDDLRAWVRTQGDRYRVRILVKSQVIPRLPVPTVAATGLWIRLEDKQRKTIAPPVKITFDGGPYPRVVRVDSRRRRVVFPFDRANGSLAPYIEEAGEVVRELIARAQEKDRTGQ